jgi:hypothetical protein
MHFAYALYEQPVITIQDSRRSADIFGLKRQNTKSKILEYGNPIA